MTEAARRTGPDRVCGGPGPGAGPAGPFNLLENEEGLFPDALGIVSQVVAFEEEPRIVVGTRLRHGRGRRRDRRRLYREALAGEAQPGGGPQSRGDPSSKPSSGSSRAPFSSHTANADSAAPYMATPA